MTEVSLERVTKILDTVRSKSVLVFGDLMLDKYLWGAVSRISPEAPVPVVDVQGETIRLGGAANVANNIVSLGASSFPVGVVGDDGSGKLLIEEIEQRGIPTSGIVTDPGRPTTVKTRVIAHNQQVVRTDREVRDQVRGDIEQSLTDRVLSGLDTCDAVIISDYGKGVITRSLLEILIPRARSAEKIVSVDPKEDHFKNYRNVSLLTPNQLEAGSAMGRRIEDEESLKQVGWSIIDLLQADALLVTRGEHGMSLFKKDRTYYHFPTVARHVYDVTGAGDTVICSFTLALCGGATMAEAAQIANHAAGVVIGDVGTAAVTAADLVASFQDHTESREEE